MSRVALLPCPSYEPAAVERALRRGIQILGGMRRFVRPGERILLKPNILTGAAPEKAVTTHPVVLETLGGLLREAGERAGLIYEDFDRGRPLARFPVARCLPGYDGIISHQLTRLSGAVKNL